MHPAALLVGRNWLIGLAALDTLVIFGATHVTVGKAMLSPYPAISLQAPLGLLEAA